MPDRPTPDEPVLDFNFDDSASSREPTTAQLVAAEDVFELTESSDECFVSNQADRSDLQTQNASSRVDLMPAMPQPSGPGFWESCGWFFGFLTVHVIGGVIAAVGMLVFWIISRGINPGDRNAMNDLTKEFTSGGSIGMILFEMLFFVAVAVLLGLLRTGREPLRKLGWRSISISHLLLIMTGAFPLMLFCGSLHVHLNDIWKEIASQIPVLDKLNLTNTNEFLKQLKDAPLPLLLIAIAICPAIGEEIIFRGVIGRGLTARYGIIAGVLMSSCFFAAAHVHPAHALAVLPLGIYMHVVYLATRSCFAPMLVHFINNGVAVVMLGFADRLKDSAVGDEKAQPFFMMFLSGSIAIGTAIALWKSRIEYLNRDGKIWNPGFATVEVPAGNTAPAIMHRPVSDWLYGAALFSGLMMTGVFVIGLVMALI